LKIDVTEIGYTDEGFEITVKAIMPDGAEWYAKCLSTENPISLEYLKIMVDNCYTVVGRKAVEYLKLEDLFD
jgi:hypothetical protein